MKHIVSSYSFAGPTFTSNLDRFYHYNCGALSLSLSIALSLPLALKKPLSSGDGKDVTPATFHNEMSAAILQ